MYCFLSVGTVFMSLRLLALARVVDRLEHQVRYVDGALALDDGALRVLLGFLHVALHHRDALYSGAALLGEDLEDLALLAPVRSGDDDDRVAAFDVEALHGQRTSGASEMIFMKFLARSSRATGPKMRVPLGLPSGPRMTMALLSKRR